MDKGVNGFVTGLLVSMVLYWPLLGIVYMSVLSNQYPKMYPPQPDSSIFRYGTWVINLVPLTVIAGLYFLLRKRHTAFARGLGYWMIVLGVLLLWGLASCRQ